MSEGEGSGIAFMRFWRPMGALENAADRIIPFLDGLKTTFNIVSAHGYSKGLEDRGGRNYATSITDTWTDKEGRIWEIKAISDGNDTGVMYYYHPPESEDADIMEFVEEDAEIKRFLNGFTIAIH